MSADLMSHVRYPTDLMKVQRSMLGSTTSTTRSPSTARTTGGHSERPAGPATFQPPYYLTMKMPNQDDPSYSMFTSFIPASQGGQARNVLTGYMAVRLQRGRPAGH